MKVNVLTLGSQGDVQPFVALGRQLAAAGHEVTLSTADPFEGFVRRHGLGFHALDGEFLRLQEAQGAMEGGGDKRALVRQVKPLLRRMLDDAWRGAQGSEMLVYHPKVLGGPDIASVLGLPAVLAVPAPFVVPTRRFPSAIVPPTWRLGGWFNRLTYALTPLIEQVFADVLRSWRRETLNVATTPSRRRAIPVLHAYSAHVVPIPDDWPPEAHVTGYWMLKDEADWQPSAALEAFLEAGPPPVYIGFGSMTSRDAAAKGRLVVEAVRLAGQRAVLASGWGALAIDEAAEDLFVLDHAPHDRLFPRVSAVVHHGGAGTTAAGLHAGRPTLVCPFFGDQPFWGDRVHQLGVGPAPLPQRRLTVEALAAGLRLLATDTGMRERAARLATALNAEDGTARATALIEAIVRGRDHRL